jgi:transposase-like protein
MHPIFPGKERYAMTETTVTPLIQPGEFCDQLTSVLRSGAQALLTQAIEAEVASFMACLEKDRDALLTFFDFPAEHWKHIRTTNPIESTFATVRHRTKKTRGCLKRNTAMVMVFKLIKEAEKRWLKLRGKNQLPKLIQGVTFSDGIETIENQTKNAA